MFIFSKQNSVRNIFFIAQNLKAQQERFNIILKNRKWIIQRSKLESCIRFWPFPKRLMIQSSLTSFTFQKKREFKTAQNFFHKIKIKSLQKQKDKNQKIYLYLVKIRLSRDRRTLREQMEILKKIRDHEFNKQNYSIDDYDESKKKLIIKISWDKKIIEFLKFLVHLTALDERYTQCGSNSLNLLVQMKVDVREQNFENIRIRNTSLFGGNFVRCNFNGSEFDNVDISGMNMNQAQLFNCKWKNIKIHELNKLDGHGGFVYSVQFSPDSKSLASCNDDNSIILWVVKTGKVKFIIKDKKEVKQICFSPNNTTLAFISGKFVYLWNLKSRKQIKKLDGHSNDVSSICFSPNGTILATGSGDNSICLWDVKIGQQKAKLDNHQYAVYSICFSPDGTTLASGIGDNSIWLWDFKTGQQKAKLDGHQYEVCSICFSPNGTILATGSGDNSICLWHVKTGQLKAKLDGHSNTVYSICFSPDGATLASGSSDNSVRLWDVETGQQKAQLNGHSGTVIQSVSLLMVLYWRLVVQITLSVYGMLRQDNKKPNQMVIHHQFIQFVTLLMVLHQHLVVMITLFVYGMLRQDNKTYLQIIVIKMLQQNLTLQKFIIIFFQTVVLIFHCSQLPLILLFQKFLKIPIQMLKDLQF
ncbi:unnamed protein product [Paramecium octaurelia]|uniref:EML-like second beta-propeller domain-containing protein n=1 Tax=Paramecium octaurelia TaxID=43137 RepID=A0A8S1UCI2_PAROT|nr:unnamed protein product [Paramecium octaurelia]